jgi:hypothetical protein
LYDVASQKAQVEREKGAGIAGIKSGDSRH